MAVEVDLQTAGQPSWHSHVAQAQYLVDGVEVVMQTLAVVGNQIRLAGLFVVPRLVGRAGLHGRQHPHQSRMLPAPGQYFLHPVLFAEGPLAEELDLDARLGHQPLSILAQLIAERLGKARIIKDLHLALVKVGGHSVRVQISAACRRSALGPNSSALPQSEPHSVP